MVQEPNNGTVGLAPHLFIGNPPPQPSPSTSVLLAALSSLVEMLSQRLGSAAPMAEACHALGRPRDACGTSEPMKVGSFDDEPHGNGQRPGTSDAFVKVAESLERLLQKLDELLVQQDSREAQHTGLVERLEASSQHILAVLEAVRARSVIDDEVRRFRTEERKTELLPLFRGLIAILDRLAREHQEMRHIRQHVQRGDITVIEEALDWLENARKLDRTDLRDLLAQYGIEPYRSPKGMRFDPHRHKAAALQAPPSSSKAGCVAGNCLPGYARRDDGWVVVPERVKVYGQESPMGLEE